MNEEVAQDPRERLLEIDLPGLWEQMYGEKGDLIRRCERYAEWTIPSICPRDTQEGQEQYKGNVAIGARLVTHLSNRIVDTMFPTDRPFFSIVLKPEARRKWASEQSDESSVAKKELQFKTAMADAEAEGMRNLNLTAYRPVAIQAASHAIVTGQALILRDGDKRVVYGVKDSCVTRNRVGELTSCILLDEKKLINLSPEMQEIFRKPGKTISGSDTVTLYTYFEFRDDRWHSIQCLDDKILPNSYEAYNQLDFPVLDITWNLTRGENNARGLVEDHAVMFHNIDVTTLAVIDLIGIAADAKYLVDPASGLDVMTLNNSPRGSYHTGKEGDITAVRFQHLQELQIIVETVKTWENELKAAFLLSNVRDAERVTTEEIRLVARELESMFGGVYSRLALHWQQREADYLVAQLEEINLAMVDIRVTTGAESVSREGQMEALRLAIADLQMLEAVPEDLRATMDLRAFAEFVFTNRGANLATFVLSQEQLEAKQKQEEEQQRRLMEMQGQNDVAVEAGKQKAKMNEQ